MFSVTISTYWKCTDVDSTISGDDGDGVTRSARAVLGQVGLKISAVEVLANESHTVVKACSAKASSSVYSQSHSHAEARRTSGGGGCVCVESIERPDAGRRDGEERAAGRRGTLEKLALLRLGELSLHTVVLDAREGSDRGDVGDVLLDGRGDGVLGGLVVRGVAVGASVGLELGGEELHNET